MKKLIIKIKPISVNKVWQGKRFRTPEYRDWIDKALWLMKKQEKVGGRIYLKITFYIKYPLKSDLDNYLKPSIDLIVRKGWIEDDRFIFKLDTQKIEVKKEEDERIEYEIKSIK